MQYKVTVVTAYYEIPSKFTPEYYWSWISNFLCNIPCNLIVFTSSNLVSRIAKLRSKFQNTVIASKEFNQLYHSMYIDTYEEHKKKDYQIRHTPELYIIWAEKVKFIMEAINLNPFKSDIFIWCDIGIFRETQFLSRFKSFPSLSDDTFNIEKVN